MEEGKTGIPPGMVNEEVTTGPPPSLEAKGKVSEGTAIENFSYGQDPRKILRNSSTATWNR